MMWGCSIVLKTGMWRGWYDDLMDEWGMGPMFMVDSYG